MTGLTMSCNIQKIVIIIFILYSSEIKGDVYMQENGKNTNNYYIYIYIILG